MKRMTFLSITLVVVLTACLPINFRGVAGDYCGVLVTEQLQDITAKLEVLHHPRLIEAGLFFDFEDELGEGYEIVGAVSGQLRAGRSVVLTGDYNDGYTTGTLALTGNFGNENFTADYRLVQETNPITETNIVGRLSLTRCDVLR